LEVQPVAADRQRIVDAPARQAVRRSIPARPRDVTIHRRLRRPKRRVAAEPGGDGGRAPDGACSRTNGRRLPLPASVALEANPTGLDGAYFRPTADTYAALGIAA